MKCTITLEKLISLFPPIAYPERSPPLFYLNFNTGRTLTELIDLQRELNVFQEGG